MPDRGVTPGPQTCVQDGSDGNALKGTFELMVATSSPFTVSLRGPKPNASGPPTQFTFEPHNADLFADSGFSETDDVSIDGCHYGCGSWIRNVGWALEKTDGVKLYQTPMPAA